MRSVLSAALLCVTLIIGAAEAQSATFSGCFNNAGNTALAGADLGPPLFANDFEIANDVALHVISIAEQWKKPKRSPGDSIIPSE